MEMLPDVRSVGIQGGGVLEAALGATEFAALHEHDAEVVGTLHITRVQSEDPAVALRK